jgi:hypothetical protein
MGSFPGSKTNYTLIAKNKKITKSNDLSRLPEIKKVIEDVIYEDFLFWKNKKLKQIGLEKNNLLKKVCCVEKSTTSQIFEFILEELELEQKILKFNEDGLIRFIWFDIKK